MLEAPPGTASGELLTDSTRPSLVRPLTVPVRAYVGVCVCVPPELPLPDDPLLPDELPLPEEELPLPEDELPLPEDELPTAAEVPLLEDAPPPQPLRANAVQAMTASWLPGRRIRLLFCMTTTL
jgi:hypothetical protein